VAGLGLLGLVASACGGVDSRFRAELVEPAAARGWQLAILLTPTAACWFAVAGEIERLQALTDLPVRSASRLPSEPKPYRMPDAFLFAPASANSVAKLALGVGDNQALTALIEAVGNPIVPVVVHPQANDDERRHPAWSTNVATLCSAGVVIADAPADAPWTPLLEVFHH
jgi:Flavoprotein